MSNIVEVVVNDKNLVTVSKGVKVAFGKLEESELKRLWKPENKVRLVRKNLTASS